ncbi:MAG TPA: hypothetical protein VJ654_12995 [Noviherbaspirillum sp.]|nr:hypothetical protein [Noviherbaspirillum sp.]
MNSMNVNRPLPAGSVIDFCGESATVVHDNGGHKLTVNASGFVTDWYWTFEGESCKVVSVPAVH